MKYEDYIKAQLVTLAYREGRPHGGREIMLAVMFVIRNRVNAGWSGGDWLTVIASHRDFHAEEPTQEALDDLLHPRFPDARDPLVRELMFRVEDVFSGQIEDHLTDQALYYAELHKVNREWFRNHILGKPVEHPRVAKIGQVDFFR